MTPDQVADQLKALEKEFKSGAIGMWNYKRPVGALFDLAYQVAEEHAELTKRVEVLESLTPLKGE